MYSLVVDTAARGARRLVLHCCPSRGQYRGGRVGGGLGGGLRGEGGLPLRPSPGLLQLDRKLVSPRRRCLRRRLRLREAGLNLE